MRTQQHKDNSHDGYTGEVYLTAAWLNDSDNYGAAHQHLGKNIRAGTLQFMVYLYDLDGDGKTEVVMRTSDGTVGNRKSARNAKPLS